MYLKTKSTLTWSTFTQKIKEPNSHSLHLLLPSASILIDHIEACDVRRSLQHNITTVFRGDVRLKIYTFLQTKWQWGQNKNNLSSKTQKLMQKVSLLLVLMDETLSTSIRFSKGTWKQIQEFKPLIFITLNVNEDFMGTYAELPKLQFITETSERVFILRSIYFKPNLTNILFCLMLGLFFNKCYFTCFVK